MSNTFTNFRHCLISFEIVNDVSLYFILVPGRCDHRGGPDPHSHAAPADDAGWLPQPDAQRGEPPDLRHTSVPQLLQRQVLWSDDGEKLRPLISSSSTSSHNTWQHRMQFIMASTWRPNLLTVALLLPGFKLWIILEYLNIRFFYLNILLNILQV